MQIQESLVSEKSERENVQQLDEGSAKKALSFRLKKDNLIRLIAGILFFLVVLIIVVVLVLLKIGKNQDEVPPKEEDKEKENPLTEDNSGKMLPFSSFSDRILPVTVSFKDFQNQGFTTKNDAFENLEKGMSENIFDFNYLSVDKTTVLERNINTRCGIGGDISWVTGSLSGQLTYENDISNSKKYIYSSVYLLVKKKELH